MTKATPTESNPRETAKDIEATAASWVARIDHAPLDAAEEAELREWAAADPRRAGAFARATAANIYLERAAALGQEFPTYVDHPYPGVTRRRVLAAAAGVAAVSAAGVGAYLLTDRGSAIDTAKGDIRRVALTEGSAVTLNTETEVHPRFASDIRRIDLVKGEALFDVTKDPARPFIVYIDDLTVRAIGTSFSVRRREDGSVGVLVREGVVEVRRDQTALGRISAGNGLTVEQSGKVAATQVPAEEMANALAWREGRIDLNGLNLGQAAAEFGRYSDFRIRVEDPSVASMRVAGIYSTSDPEGFAKAAALSLGLQSASGNNEIRIYR